MTTIPDTLLNRVVCMDALAYTRALPDSSVQTIITSPPYFGLRDYGADGQIGLEQTPAEYVCKLVELFREARRVLADDGTLWLNLGDSYSSGTIGRNDSADGNTIDGRHVTSKFSVRQKYQPRNTDLPPKSLLGIPWRVAFALQDDGWILRSDIIWHKPNPMPENVTDRPTKSHEYVFLFSKQPRYYYDADAIKEPVVSGVSRGTFRGGGSYVDHNSFQNNVIKGSTDAGKSKLIVEDRNKRTVWTVPTQGTPEAHFATFPRKLIMPMILAGSRPGDVVFDPFMGSGTTAIVARELGRQFVGCDISQEYVDDIANRRLAMPYTLPMMFGE